MATDETRVEKLARLATVNVREYNRFERGKQQTVRPHTETRDQAAAQNGWIPEPDWKEGQTDWVKKGEAIWKSRAAGARARGISMDAAADKAADAKDKSLDQQNRETWNRLNREDYERNVREGPRSTSADWLAQGGSEIPARGKSNPAAVAEAAQDKAAAAKNAAQQARGGVRSGADRRSHAPTSARGQARAERMAARGGKLQDRVHQMEQDRQASADKVANHPLFNKQPLGQEATPADQLINEAANRAVQDAMLRSGQVDQNELGKVMAEMTSMKSQLAALTEKSVEQGQVEKKIESGIVEKERATMALNLLGILAGVLMIAVTSGVGSMIGEVMAFGWTAEIAKELIQYHGIAKNTAVKRVLAHPAKKAAEAAPKVAKVVSEAPKVAAKTLGAPLHKTE